MIILRRKHLPALGLSLSRSGLPIHELKPDAYDAKMVGLDEVSALLPHLPLVPIRPSLAAEDIAHQEETRSWKSGL